jgi:hypothetical protein
MHFRLIMVVGAFMALSARLAADCDMGVALRFLKKHHMLDCEGWPYGPGEHAECQNCINEIVTVCHVWGTSMRPQQTTPSGRQITHWDNACVNLGSTKKRKPSVSPHTP